jgi:hypothetical protein
MLLSPPFYRQLLWDEGKKQGKGRESEIKNAKRHKGAQEPEQKF